MIEITNIPQEVFSEESLAELFEVQQDVIRKHLEDIFADGELDENSIIKESFYNFDVLLAVGYRVESRKGVEFRRFLNDFIKNNILNYINLTGEIRAIRLSDNSLSQKAIDLFKTSYDYNENSKTAHDFYVKVQNNLSDKSDNTFNRVLDLYLGYGELQSQRHIPMSMNDWSGKLDNYFDFIALSED